QVPVDDGAVFGREPGYGSCGVQGYLLVGVGAPAAWPRDRRGVRTAAGLLLADRAGDEEAASAPARSVRPGRAAGADRLVDGDVRRQHRADVCCALPADDALRPCASDHRILFLALARTGEQAAVTAGGSRLGIGADVA